MKLSAAFCLALVAASSIVSAQVAPTLRKAPDLTFTLPNEGQKTLSQYKGKVVAVEFILTTCVHCQAASQVMTRLQNEYGSQGFQVLDLALNGLDEGRDAKAADSLVSAFKSNYNVGFPVGWLQREQMPAFMGFSIMERTVVPQLALIDRQGFIHYQTPPKGDENSMLESTLRERVQQLLAMRPAPASSQTRKPVRKQT